VSLSLPNTAFHVYILHITCLLISHKRWRYNNEILFVFTVLQESVATLSGTLPGLMAEGDQEEEAEGISDINYY